MPPKKEATYHGANNQGNTYTSYSDGSYSYRNVSDGGHLRSNVYVDKSENMFVHSSSASKEQGQHSFYQTNQGDRSYVSKKTGEYHK